MALFQRPHWTQGKDTLQQAISHLPLALSNQKKNKKKKHKRFSLLGKKRETFCQEKKNNIWFQ